MLGTLLAYLHARSDVFSLQGAPLPVDATSFNILSGVVVGLEPRLAARLAWSLLAGRQQRA